MTRHTHTIKASTALACTLLLGACTWVHLDSAAETVRVAQSDAVKNCTSKGKVTVSTKAYFGNIDRSPEKVASELETLARNEAARSAANTVVAETAIDAGRRVYGIYQCPRN